MLSRKHSLEGKEPFGTSLEMFQNLPSEVASKVAMVAGDIVLVLDDTGLIVDATANAEDFPEYRGWIGCNWLDTVTVESRPKVVEMLASARKGSHHRWRQVNHAAAGSDIPVRYTIVSVDQGRSSIAFGRDMREAAALQQRLLQAQQSLERDYLGLRQVEARYRLLFDLSEEPVVIVDSETYRVQEANRAAHTLFHAKAGGLVGNKFNSLFVRSARDPLIAFLGSAVASKLVQPIELETAAGGSKVSLSATGYRQRGGKFLLVRLMRSDRADIEHGEAMLDVLEAMPDAFVLTDEDKAILAANTAFIELVNAASADQVRGQKLAEFVGRPGIDLELIDEQLTKHDSARNVSTVVCASDGIDGEPIELSAVRIPGGTPCYGFVMRPIGRRLRDLPMSDDLPRSVEQLTELVGRMSLKDIVRESTDLIERLCIEAALGYTSNNRASAAEILGLSRQSLYSKLNRYGLSNPASQTD